MTVKLHSADEVAAMLGVELDTLYRYARRGEIRGIKIGKLWRFSDADLQEFLQNRRFLSRRSEGHDTQINTLSDMLRSAARSASPGSIIFAGHRITYAEVETQSDRLARRLVANGIKPGDRVLVLLPNSSEFVVACYAVWRCRAVLIPDFVAIRPPNLRHILEDARPKALVVDRSVAPLLEEMPDALGSVEVAFLKEGTFALSGLNDIRVESLTALEHDEHVDAELHGDPRPDDIASITYTSGSTGMPKGVIHTHDSWLAGAEFTRDYAGLTAADKMVVSLPLHHGLAFRQLLAYTLANATLIIAGDIYQALKSLRDDRPTALVQVPAACNLVLDHFAPVLREADSFLRYVEIGSAAMPPERLRRLRELLPTTPVFLPYGLTEARVGFLKEGEGGQLNRLTAISPGLSIRVIDADGNSVAPGDIGEIVLQGRGLMHGYWGRSTDEHTRIREFGFRTGDQGRLTRENEVELLGRMDDVLKVGGRKVNPQEVEMALNRHPAVTESAVIGLLDPSGIFELRLHAFVVPKGAAKPTESDLLAHCRQFVEPYKIPAQIHFRASLPKSPVGKLLRQQLRVSES